MAVSMLEERLAKNLECAICLDTYDDPRMLRCQHCYCRKCLEKIVSRVGRVHKLTCPECREVIKLPLGGVASLQSSFLVKDLLNLSVNTGVQSNASPPCDKHQEELVELYCETCDEPVCQACLVIDHRDHSYTSIKDVFYRKKRDIARLMNESKPKISALKAEVLSVEDEENKTRNNALAVSQEIDTFIDGLINKHTTILEHERQRLKQEVSENASLQLTKLHDHKEALVVGLSSVEFAKQTLDYENKVEFLRSKKDVTSKITELRSLTEEFHPCEKVVYKLDKNAPEEEHMQGIGKVKAQSQYCLGMRGGEPGILYTGRARQLCEFVITFNSEETSRSDQRNLMDHFKVTILGPNNDAPYYPVLENKGDGSRSFEFRPGGSGDYKISILNEKLFGGEVHSSPVIWKVLPALYLRSWVGWFNNFGFRDYTYLNQCVFEGGQHSWRIKLLPQREPRLEPRDYVFLRIGVVHPFHSDSFRYWMNGHNFSCDNCVPSSVKSLQCGDLFICFLDLDKRQLTIFNDRTKESDTWRDIEAPVSPYLSPDYFLCPPYFDVLT